MTSVSACTAGNHDSSVHDCSRTNKAKAPPGIAKRSDGYDELVRISSEYRLEGVRHGIYEMSRACNFLDLKPGPRGLLHSLILHLNHGSSEVGEPSDRRFVVFPGNGYLALALHVSERSIQRWAALLEAKGLLRRCYSATNTRIGYDLTGFVAQVGSILAAFEKEVAANRQARLDARQHELDLGETQAADRRETTVPLQTGVSAGMTKLSSRGDSRVSQNRKPKLNIESTTSFGILDLVPMDSLVEASGLHIAEEDRTGDKTAAAILAVTRLMTGPSGHPSAPWRNAVALLGEERATVLWLCAMLDPMRRGASAQYFAWLIKAVQTPKLVSAVTAAIGRAKDRASAKVRERRSAQEQIRKACAAVDDWDVRTASGEAPSAANDHLVDELRRALPPHIASRFLDDARAVASPEGITVMVGNAFHAQHLAANYPGALDRVAKRHFGPQAFVVLRSAGVRAG